MLYFYIYIFLGIINLVLMLSAKANGKDVPKRNIGMMLLLAPFAILFFPVNIALKYSTYQKYKKLLKGRVVPFYRYIYSNQIN